MKSLRENLFLKFSLVTFAAMLLIGGGIAWFLGESLGELLQLLEQHAAVMSSGSIQAANPTGISDVYAAVERLRLETIAVFVAATFVLYISLVLIVHQGWRTIEIQRDELAQSNQQLRAMNQERQLLLEAERENRVLADSLRRVGLALSATLDLQELLNHISRESMELLNTGAAYVWLVRGEQLVGFAGSGAGRDSFLGLSVAIDDPTTLGPRIVRQKQPIYINHCRESTRVRQDLIERFDVQSILGVPLIAKNEAIGALMIIDTEQPDRFSDADVKLAQVLASHAAVAIDNAQMFEGLSESRQELEHAYDSTLEGWSRALELRDHETGGHTQRVAAMTVRLARELGMTDDELVHVRRGALLHDMGKMAIPDRILRKPGPLSDGEWEIMRKHPTYAYDMLSPIEYLKPALDIPYCHHEKWDGSGYPRGLAGEDIPLAARAFAVIDVYDALICDRPYRAAWPEQRVLAYIEAQAGQHFDPEIVPVFLSLMPELASVSMLDGAPPVECREEEPSPAA